MKYDILCVGSVEAELVFTTKLSQPTSLVPRLRRAQQSQTHIEAREAVFGMAGGQLRIERLRFRVGGHAQHAGGGLVRDGAAARGGSREHPHLDAVPDPA